MVDAVHTGARFVLVILDNHVTAMTGFQPTVASKVLAMGETAAHKVSIPELVRACGVTFVRVVDPYEHQAFRQVLREARLYAPAPKGGVAVVIADHPCVLYEPSLLQQDPHPVRVTEACDGCGHCLQVFECPALVLRPDGKRVETVPAVCVQCGRCVDACPKGAIVAETAESVEYDEPKTVR